MEFAEKLQELRKSRGITQEELAEALYVSRTAVSKWESGRGYPSIDSLKAISAYFSVTIDDLLSGEKLLVIAEKENTSNIQRLYALIFGITDLFSFILIILPLYPESVEGFVYSVNLLMYRETAEANRVVYWAVFLGLILTGVLKLLLTQLQLKKMQRVVTGCSIVLSIAAVIFLALAGETYAVTVAFLLLLCKGLLLFKHAKAEK